MVKKIKGSISYKEQQKNEQLLKYIEKPEEEEDAHNPKQKRK